MAGVALALASAACFGTLAILVKEAYAAGLSVRQLIAGRFLVASVCLWLICAATGRPPWRMPRRSLAVLGLMGMTLYSLQAFSFIFAVATLPASLVSLVLYTYPALVAVGARVVFGRRLGALHVAGLAASFLGVALLVGGVARFAPTTGLLFAALAPLIYTVYILAGDYAMRQAGAGSRAPEPVAAATVVMTGSAVAFVVVAALGGELRPPPGSKAALLVVAIGLVPTVAAITLFLAALPRIGAGRTALLSTAEPVVTVALAAAILGERLAPVQALGALLVLSAVVAIQWPRGASRPR